MQIAIDVGSGVVKGQAGDERVSMPSLAAPAPEAAADGFQLGELDTVTMAGERFVVGDSARVTAQRSERCHTLSADYAGSRGWFALLYAAVAQLLPVGEHEIELTTGLPVAQFRDRRQELHAALACTHKFETPAGSFVLHPTDVRVLPQAAGAMLAAAADDESLLDDDVGVIDVGTFTTDFTVLSGGKFVSYQSDGVSAGVSALIDELDSYLVREHGANVDHAALARTLARRSIRYRGELIDLTEVIGRLSALVARPILSALSERWGDAGTLSVLLAGGGAHLFADVIQQQYPHAKIISGDPAFAVVRGYAAYAAASAS